MKLRMFSIRDTKTDAFDLPFYAHNEGHAMRMVTDMAASGKFVFSRHPADFALFEVGTFDDQTGELTALTVRSIIFLDEILKGATSEKDN